MSETHETLRLKLLKAALPLVTFDGWSEKTIAEAARDAGIPAGEVQLLLPRGPIDLLELYSDWADGEMLKVLEGADLQSMKIRERITFAVRTRLEILARDKEASSRALSILALPIYAPISAKLLYRTVDQIWRGIGDVSTDFNFYTKRATLAAVYSTTLLTFVQDDSYEHEESWSFLDRRIEDVMSFEKAKAKVRSAVDKLPSVTSVLSALRYPGPAARR